MPAEREGGFTLVEVLVALVMAALLSAILIAGAGAARARLRHAHEERQAVFLARSLLARAAAAPFDPSARSGAANGLKWSMNEQILLPDLRGQYALVGLHLTVANDAGTKLFAGDARRLKRMPRS